MVISDQLQAFLQASRVSYAVQTHSTVYTAQEIAAAQHVPGRQLAKSVLVNTDRGPFLAVLPAIHLINLKQLRGVLGVKTLTIAKEADIKQRFPDVEVGAMSPFGNLYQIPVVVDRSLAEVDEIVFNGGSHTDTVKMRYRDFAALVQPKIGTFGQPISLPASSKRATRRPGGKKTKKANAARSRSSAGKHPATARPARSAARHSPSRKPKKRSR